MRPRDDVYMSGEILYPPQVKRMTERALKDTEGFWGEVADELYWFKKWERAFEWKYPHFRWFIKGITNLSYNCVDHNVKHRGFGNKAAIVWECGETGETRILTYNRLLFEVSRFASTLRALGVEKGDRVTIYMPMIPEAAIAMLAITRIGAIHSVVFGGFGSSALAERIKDSESKVLVTADIGYRRGKTVELKSVVDEALKNPNTIGKVIMFKRGGGDPSMKEKRDLLWEEALDLGKDHKGDFIPLDSNDLAFILYTSGTTAKPKGTVQTHGSYQVFIYAMGKWVYDMKPADMWWSTSDIGWIVGHSYVLYAPLLIGCSTVMFEGVPDYPSPDVWWKVIESNKVTQLWASPTGIRAVMKYGERWPTKHDLSSLRLVVSAGEVLNPPAWEWLQKKVLGDRIPVIDHMWQTESSGPMIGNPYGICMMPIKPGSATIPLPGIETDIVDKNGKSLPTGEKGHFVCKRPFPGLTPSLWRNDERYVSDYWDSARARSIPNCYYTGDVAVRDVDGYYFFLGRMDEIIKIAGHRVGTIEVESVILTHPAVAEAAVVGRPDELRGEIASAFVVLRSGNEPSEELKDKLKKLVRNQMGPIIVLDINFVNILPKTRSGKIMRRLIKAVLTDQPLGDYSTIEDEASIKEIIAAAMELKKSLNSKTLF